MFLVHLKESWKKLLDQRKFAGVLFIDFRKAFNTVDHTIMGHKLQQAGFSGNIALTIQNYLNKDFSSQRLTKEPQHVGKLSAEYYKAHYLGQDCF